MNCISCDGCQEKWYVMRRWRCIFTRRSWTLSKNTSGVSGFPHCWGSPHDVPRLDPQAKFQARNHTTYDRFRDMNQNSHEEALAVARDAHQWASVAAGLLEDKIERMSCSLSHSCQCSRSWRCSCSCQRRFQTANH